MKKESDSKDNLLLDCFWNLSSLNQETRKGAAAQLTHMILDHQQDTTDAISSVFLSALDRLIRGIYTNRLGARQGFSLALTELLKRIKDYKIEEVIATVQKIWEGTSQIKVLVPN